jgi:hypothetical protein
LDSVEPEIRGRFLPSCKSAIDWDHSARHIVGQIGRQELDNLGAILDGPEPPKRDQLGSIAIALAAARNDGPPGGDHTGRETVGRDPERVDTAISSA